jgi:hypothetical protein
MQGSAPIGNFSEWLRNQHMPSSIRLNQIIVPYGRPISTSAAYRACRSLGVKGHRTNKSRYDSFWHGLNWSLPNSILAQIWGIDYGNLRARRIRLGIHPPKWLVRRDAAKQAFQLAIQAEKLKRRYYRGPRPSSPK